MRSGLLNEPITVKRHSITKNKFGEDVESWSTVINTRARVVNSRGSRSEQTDEIQYPYQKTLIVRYYVDVTDYDIIIWRDKRYRILSIDKSRDLRQITIQIELINE